MSNLKLYGRIIISANIKAETGLHIGGSGTGMVIGGIDKEVIRNPLTGEPYIPGSSLRGKMRSLLDKVEGKDFSANPLGIHVCKTESEYSICEVCQVFGIAADRDSKNKFASPTRLIVRDVHLTKASKDEFDKLSLDINYGEIKIEVAIDRVTSAANPRSIERVPAGAEFGPMQLVFSVFGKEDIALIKNVFRALMLVEDDYLGGSGSRGSGQVSFHNLSIASRASNDYEKPEKYYGESEDKKKEFENLASMMTEFADIQVWANNSIPTR